jgi:hypothetical protein
MTDKTAAKLPKMYGLRRDELHGGMGRGKRLPRSLMPRNGCDLVAPISTPLRRRFFLHRDSMGVRQRRVETNSGA